LELGVLPSYGCWRRRGVGVVDASAHPLSVVPSSDLLRAGVLVLASASISPAGEVRGVAPADVASSSPRLRCSRRTTHAALQRGWSSIVPSRQHSGCSSSSLSGSPASRRRGRLQRRIVQEKLLGCFCVFLLSQGPFCKSGQLYSFWMYLMFI
jgi:hypothetical protein